MSEPSKTLTEVIRHFENPMNCVAAMVAMRWPDGNPVCPHCGDVRQHWLATQMRWKCYGCRKQFSVKVGTVMEDSPIALDKWLVTLWMLVNCKNGISSYEVMRTVGVTQKSAWFMLQRLRLALQEDKDGKLGGTVEMDETFVGGKLANMHKSKKPVGATKSRGVVGKAIVVGMLERNGRVRAEVVMERTQETLHDLVAKNLDSDATLMTDEWGGYKGTDLEHQVINHAYRYVSGLIHTQGIENFWSLLKRGLNGTYISVEPFHLFRYIDEQAFRFNNRKHTTDEGRFMKALSQIAGKRLTYAELTGQVAGSF
ncbi:MAG: IS1595 family transposase [Terracidiphilus sp.]